VALNLYLDDCANADLLADLLRQAGHTVVRPGDVGMLGEEDDAHLAYAVAHGLILLTKNPHDFQDLHYLDQNHPGIFAVYQDNNVITDMSDADIVAAIARIEAAVPLGFQIAGEFHNLNAWRS
jgi:predicted nuclease of predicted toxin-antitoxin system